MARALTKHEAKRRKFLLRNHNLLLSLYPNTFKIYGPYLGKDNRYRVVFYDGHKRQTRQYAKVKMELKLERRIEDPETVDHKNENTRNDRYSNLQILTRAENAAKSANGENFVKYSRSKKGRSSSRKRLTGDTNPNARFPEKKIKKLRKLYANGMVTRYDIAIKYSVSEYSVKSMLTGRTYGHVKGAVKLQRGR